MLEGYLGFKPDPRLDPPERTRFIGPYEVVSMDIPSYFTGEFAQAAGLWGNWKRFGWPYVGGWAEQPAHIVDIVSAFEEEFADKNNPPKTQEQIPWQ